MLRKRGFAILLAVIFLFITQFSNLGVNKVQAATGNLLSNGTFSKGLTGWNDEGHVASIINEGVDDSSSVRINATLEYKLFSMPVIVEANTEYVMTYYTRGSGTLDAGIGQGWNNQITSSISKSVYWVMNKIYFTTGNYTTTSAMFITHGNGNVDVDKISIYKISDSPIDPTLVENLGPNIVQNGNFEIVDSKGIPAFWGNQTGTGLGFNGSGALVVNSTNGYVQTGVDLSKYVGKVMRSSFKAKYLTLGDSVEMSFSDTVRFNKIGKLKIRNDRWTTVTSEFVVPEGAKNGVVFFHINDSNVILVDDFIVAEVLESPYILTPSIVTKTILTPVNGDSTSLRGGVVCGSNETATNGFVTIATVPETASGTSVTLDTPDNSTAYRYIKYYGKIGSSGKVAEIEFFNGDIKLKGDSFATVPTSGHEADKAFDGNIETYYEGQLPDDQYVGLDCGGETAAAMPTVNVAPGRYEAPIDITLSTTTQSAEIYYTTNGKLPTKATGIKYVTPIHVAQGEALLLKAIAIKSGLPYSPMFAGGFGIGINAPVPAGLRTYSLGNSLTDTVVPWLAPIAEDAGYAHKFMRWTIPGASLPVLDLSQTSGFGDPWVDSASCSTSTTFGEPYTEVFHSVSFGKPDVWFNPSTAAYAVDKFAPIDVLTVQPFDNGDNIQNGISLGKKYYDRARISNPNIRYLIYSSWGSLYNKNNANEFDNQLNNYTLMNEGIAAGVNAFYTNDPEVNIVPNALALKNLRTEILNGTFPGNVADFATFAAANKETDPLHLSSAGAYLVAMTTYTVMYKSSPVGNISIKPTTISEDQARALQQIAWDTCLSYSKSGVSNQVPPTPTATPIVTPTATSTSTATPTIVPSVSPSPTQDVVAPIIKIGNYTKLLTNKNISVTASVNEGTLNSNNHTFKSNGSFLFTAVDIAGNKSTVKVTIANIDKTAPKIVVKNSYGKSISNNSYSKRNAVITVSDLHLLKKSLKYNGKTVKWPARGKVVRKGSYVVTARDKANNESMFKFKVK